MTNSPPPPCPVCTAPSPRHLAHADARDYWRCGVCQARFLDPADRLAPGDERDQYLHHENDPGDPAYRRFLARLSEPLMEKLTPGMSSLDYGCGPGPALAAMLREAGMEVALYDPYFAPDETPLSKVYDFIVCTETAEHFYAPAREFARFDAMLRPGGWLGIMTCFQTDDDRFANWHYRKDPTHVVFYREATLRWIAVRHGWSCEIPCKDVALMQKPGAN